MARLAQASWIAEAAAVGTETPCKHQLYESPCLVMNTTYHREHLDGFLPVLARGADEPGVVIEGNHVKVRRRHLTISLNPGLKLGSAYPHVPA